MCTVSYYKYGVDKVYLHGINLLCLDPDAPFCIDMLQEKYYCHIIYHQYEENT
jgi:hypothetical protein